MKILFLLYVLLLASLGTSAQMTEQDKHVLIRIKKELQLTDIQLYQVDQLFQSTQHQLDSIQQRINELQLSSEDGATLSTKLSVLQQKKKDLKQDRELGLATLLSGEQNKSYQSTIKPVKPNVLHFGVNHDRAACIVCK